MTEGELMAALVPVINGIDGGCKACVGSFVLNANKQLDKTDCEFRFMHHHNWMTDEHVSVVLKRYLNET